MAGSEETQPSTANSQDPLKQNEMDMDDESEGGTPDGNTSQNKATNAEQVPSQSSNTPTAGPSAAVEHPEGSVSPEKLPQPSSKPGDIPAVEGSESTGSGTNSTPHDKSAAGSPPDTTPPTPPTPPTPQPPPPPQQSPNELTQGQERETNQLSEAEMIQKQREQDSARKKEKMDRERAGQELVFNHSTFLEWPEYEGTFDIWQPVQLNQQERGHTIKSKPAAQSYFVLLEELCRIITDWNEKKTENQCAQFQIANSLVRALEKERDFEAAWQFSGLEDIGLVSIISRSAYDQSKVPELLTEGQRESVSTMLTKLEGIQNLKAILANEITLRFLADIVDSQEDDGDSASNDDLEDLPEAEFDIKKVKLDLAMAYDHIKTKHEKMTPDILALFDHCKTYGRNPDQEHIDKRSALIKALDAKMNEIEKENKEHGLDPRLGVVNASVLASWYTMAVQDGDSLYGDYVLWIERQFPISFLRKKADCRPSYRGKYPGNGNLQWYYKAQHGYDPFANHMLTSEEQEQEKNKFQNAKFFRSIYPAESNFARQPIRPSKAMPNEDSHDGQPKIPTVRKPLNLTSHGSSTEQFEPGWTIFGKQIIAVDKRQLRDGAEEDSRLYMVRTADKVYHMYNESDVGGRRIFTLCKNLPNVMNIIRKKEDLPVSKNDFQANGWGIKYVATKPYLNSPSPNQPSTTLVATYRDNEHKELIEIAMSRECLIHLVRKKNAQTFISRALAGSSGVPHSTMWPHMPPGIQRLLRGPGTSVDARRGKATGGKATGGAVTIAGLEQQVGNLTRMMEQLMQGRSAHENTQGGAERRA